METRGILNSNLIREGIFERNILEQKREFQTNSGENIPIHGEFKFAHWHVKYEEKITKNRLYSNHTSYLRLKILFTTR